MKDWKVRQQLTHKLHQHDDLIENEEMREWKREELRDIDFLSSVLAYFFREGDGVLHYPQKSYSVAVIYAKLLEKYFQEDFYEVLNDPDLLPSDKYFVPYLQDQEVYDQVITTLTTFNKWDFESNPISRVQATVRYFKKEFLLE
jgi:hypothetical protein